MSASGAAFLVVAERAIFHAVAARRPGNAQIPVTISGGSARERCIRTPLASRAFLVRIVVLPTVARPAVAHEKPTDAFAAGPALEHTSIDRVVTRAPLENVEVLRKNYAQKQKNPHKTPPKIRYVLKKENRMV